MILKKILFNKRINKGLFVFNFSQSFEVDPKDKNSNSKWIYSSKYD